MAAPPFTQSTTGPPHHLLRQLPTDSSSETPGPGWPLMQVFIAIVLGNTVIKITELRTKSMSAHQHLVKHYYVVDEKANKKSHY